jgi:prophage maintenance system killer protein
VDGRRLYDIRCARCLTGLVFSCYALRLLALNHCLVDGNKRLAWLAFVSGLAALRLSIDVSDDDAEAFVNRIVTDHLDGQDVVRWASERLVVFEDGLAASPAPVP